MEPQSKTPAPDHIEFDLLCLGVDDFEPLPSLAGQHPEPESESEAESSLDGQILAALVTP